MRCVAITPTRHAVNDGDAEGHASLAPAVLLDGRAMAKPLPQVYPNGAVNRHRCDLPALRYQCDLNVSVGCMAYPQLFPTGDLLKNWSPEDPGKQPAHIFDSICRFNVSSPYELQLAQVFHQMEVPFITYGIPELDRASTKWTDEYLTEKLRPDELYKVHIANNSHFMYYSKSMARLDEPPTYASKWWTYPQFVDAVAGTKAIEKKGSDGDHANHPYYYLMLKALDIKKRTPFVYEELEFLDPSAGEAKRKYGDLFIRDTQDALARGLRCRLGMQGIITEGHFDAGLNMITMVRGAKRYILSPPSVCSCLGIITSGASARHTRLNWSNVAALSSDAYACPATEVVVAAGDVLYVPSYWYHHIVSLDESIQCNIRSGVILRDDVKDFLAQCGFPPVTEAA
uniref:JmjC domain-containing protein n=1 Tax=Globisporangium ultimum (strain ATCC 200006 / CBS 805.95 / DAOM BR144) TaxID=431595 RepID=K3WAU3_GLOUD